MNGPRLKNGWNMKSFHPGHHSVPGEEVMFFCAWETKKHPKIPVTYCWQTKNMEKNIENHEIIRNPCMIIEPFLNKSVSIGFKPLDQETSAAAAASLTSPAMPVSTAASPAASSTASPQSEGNRESKLKMIWDIGFVPPILGHGTFMGYSTIFLMFLSQDWQLQTLWTFRADPSCLLQKLPALPSHTTGRLPLRQEAYLELLPILLPLAEDSTILPHRSSPATAIATEWKKSKKTNLAIFSHTIVHSRE